LERSKWRPACSLSQPRRVAIELFFHYREL
jgi:hypothetical protein